AVKTAGDTGVITFAEIEVQIGTGDGVTESSHQVPVVVFDIAIVDGDDVAGSGRQQVPISEPAGSPFAVGTGRNTVSSERSKKLLDGVAVDRQNRDRAGKVLKERLRVLVLAEVGATQRHNNVLQVPHLAQLVHDSAHRRRLELGVKRRKNQANGHAIRNIFQFPLEPQVAVRVKPVESCD